MGSVGSEIFIHACTESRDAGINLSIALLNWSKFSVEIIGTTCGVYRKVVI